MYGLDPSEFALVERRLEERLLSRFARVPQEVGFAGEAEARSLDLAIRSMRSLRLPSWPLRLRRRRAPSS